MNAPKPPGLVARVLDRATRPPVLTVFAVLQACLIGVAAAAHLATRVDPQESGGEPGTGDFAAFYLGAVLVREGRGAELYDVAIQRELQQRHLGPDLDQWQHYLNPPALAMVLAPATRLGYVPSFLLFTAGLLASLLAGLIYLLRALPATGGSRRSAATALLLAVGFLPVALTTFGGQNTSLTLALLCGVYAAIRRGNPTLAGLFLGLLTYKPQYALLPGLVLALQRETRVVAVAALVALVHYAAGALACGPSWPLEYLAFLAEHTPRELADNAPWQVSLPTASRYSLPGAWGAAVGIGGSLAALGLLLMSGFRVRRDSARYPAFFAMLVACTLLVSPQLQYYEVGILALPALLALETVMASGKRPSLRARLLLAAGYLAFPTWELSEALGFQPLLLMPVALFAWTTWLTLQGAERP